MTRDRRFDGTIQWLRSAATGKVFPHLVFRGDVDFVTSGLVSLTSVDASEIVAELHLPEEIYLRERPESAKECEARINQELGRNDLRVITLLRTESDTINASGMSFQEYLAIAKAPRLFYRDIYSEDGEATVVREESIEQFLKSGGILLDRTKSTQPDADGKASPAIA